MRSVCASWLTAPHMGKIIAVASGKGGTGKTTTVAAVSSCLAALGHRTICIDFDYDVNTLDETLCIPASTRTGRLEDSGGGGFVTGAIFEHPRIPNLYKLPIISMGSPDNVNVADLLPIFDDIRDRFDYCLIDTPSGVGAGCKLAHIDADVSIVITTGESAVLRDVTRAANGILDTGVGNIQLIVNRVNMANIRSIRSSIDEVVSATGLRTIGIIPEDKNVFRAFHDNIPLIHYYKRRAMYHFLDVSRRVAGEAVPWRIRLDCPVYPVFSAPNRITLPPEETVREHVDSAVREQRLSQDQEQPEYVVPDSPALEEPRGQTEADTQDSPVLEEPHGRTEAATQDPPVLEEPQGRTEISHQDTKESQSQQHLDEAIRDISALQELNLSDDMLLEPSSVQKLEQLDDLLELYPPRQKPGQPGDTAEQADNKQPGDDAGNPTKLPSEIPEHLISQYGDPNLWARSTFVPDGKEPLILIREIKLTGDDDRGTLLQRTWLHDLLDENNIPYHIEIGGHWTSNKNFSDIQGIYVKKAHGGKAISLIRKFESPPEPVPDRLKAVYGDPELWAHSTFEPSDDEALVLIHEIKPSGQTGRGTFMQRTWVHDVFDDNDIPYHIEIGGHWKSRRNFSEIQSIYVKKVNSGKAINLMRAYENPENILKEAKQEKEEDIEYENGIPQKVCPACGKNVDFDHYKCPHCKAIVQ